MKGGGAAPSHGPCFSLPCLTQPWAPKSARASHWYPREACRMSSVPCLRQGLRNPRVPSILASDRGSGPPVCPASCAPDRGSGPPCAQHHVPQTGAKEPRVPSIMCPRQTSLNRSQCNSVLTREEECVFKFPRKSQRPRGQRPTTCSLQSLQGVGATGWRQPGLEEGILVTAGRMEDWKSRKSQDVFRVRPYSLVVWISWS